MIYYLWIKIPLDLGPLDGKAYAIDPDTKEPLHPSVDSSTIEKLTGLLSWYAPAIPIAATFTYSLFRLGHKHRYRVLLTPPAARDLAFWRAIIILLVMYPHLLGASISSLQLLRRTLYYLQTDASSTIGGGGTLTDSPEWIPGISCLFFVIRWYHADEIASMETLQQLLLDAEDVTADFIPTIVSCSAGFQVTDNGTLVHHINVREYVAACNGLLLFGYYLRDSTVDFGGDNTTCLFWLVKTQG